MEPKRKTTLLLDPEVWRAFQEDVLRHEGNRALSSEVEKLLRGTSLEAYAEAMAGTRAGSREGLPSLQEVERTRPRVRVDVAALIREERDDREARVSGLQRHRKKVSRRSRD